MHVSPCKRLLCFGFLLQVLNGTNAEWSKRIAGLVWLNGIVNVEQCGCFTIFREQVSGERIQEHSQIVYCSVLL